MGLTSFKGKKMSFRWGIRILELGNRDFTQGGKRKTSLAGPEGP